MTSLDSPALDLNLHAWMGNLQRSAPSEPRQVLSIRDLTASMAIFRTSQWPTLSSMQAAASMQVELSLPSYARLPDALQALKHLRLGLLESAPQVCEGLLTSEDLSTLRSRRCSARAKASFRGSASG